MGTEVKSLRLGRASLVDSFATIDDGEVWLRGLHIPEYTHGSWTNHEPRRNRKLLMHREEIERLIGKTREGGLTLVPLALYFRDGKVKLELALARGKRDYDKRQDLAKARRGPGDLAGLRTRGEGACAGDAVTADRNPERRLTVVSGSGMIRRAGGAILERTPQGRRRG